MALIDALRDLEDLPESHIPALNEIQQIVGKLAAYAEHGDGLFKAAEAGAQDVAELLAEPHDSQPTEHDQAAAPVTSPSAAAPAGVPAESAVATPDATDPAGTSDADKDAEIAALKQQLATAQANAQRTQVEVGPAETPSATDAATTDTPAQTAPTTAAPTPETW